MRQTGHSGFVVSLKYAPWHYAFMTGFVRQFRLATGGSAKFLLSNAYRWMFSGYQNDQSAFLGQSDSTASMVVDCIKFVAFRWFHVLRYLLNERPQFLYFVNPHPLNPVIGLLAKIAVGDCKILTHVHEPEANQTAKRLDLRAYEALIQLIQACAIRCSDVVVVSSNRARSTVQSKYPIRPENVHFVPLLIEDFAASKPDRRQYITYLGSARRQRGIDKFLQFAEYCFKKRIDLKFQIVTKDDISEFLGEIDPQVLQRLRILNKAYISNEEIAAALSQSLACCVLYTSEMMQSGVVPVALMTGTPVIVTPFRGLTDFVTDSENAIVLTSEIRNEEILQAIERIHGNLSDMCKKARETFDNTFHEKNWPTYFPSLLAHPKAGTDSISASL